MTKIVFLDRDTMAPQIKVPKPAVAHDWAEHDRTRPDQTVERLKGAAVAITNKVRIGAAELEQLPDLKLIAVAATGYDCVDVAACEARGVVVCNVQGYAINTVPEHVFALLLALRRNVVNYRRDVIDGEWQKARQFCFFNHPIRDLAGATIGIVGRGAIGSSVARIARGFNMRVVYRQFASVPPGEESLPFEELLACCDVLTLHCPLTDETRHMLDDAAFARMTRKPIVINTARGALIDPAALERALEAGLISGAGIDVAEQEPPAADSVLMRLAARPDMLLTPHVAWASDEAQQTVADQLIGNIEAFLKGAPRNLVTKA